MAPASLRIYALSKHLRTVLVDPMESYDLFRELECYAAAEHEEQRRVQQQQRRQHGRAGRRR